MYENLRLVMTDIQYVRAQMGIQTKNDLVEHCPFSMTIYNLLAFDPSVFVCGHELRVHELRVHVLRYT